MGRVEYPRTSAEAIEALREARVARRGRERWGDKKCCRARGKRRAGLRVQEDVWINTPVHPPRRLGRYRGLEERARAGAAGQPNGA
jgi:hypothetical protein